jgi:hypothetical protein
MAVETRLTIRVPTPIIEALTDEASEQFLPISHLVRVYLLQGLAKAGRRCRPDTHDAPFRHKRRPEQAEHAAA